jgi:hypothetical protein
VPPAPAPSAPPPPTAPEPAAPDHTSSADIQRQLAQLAQQRQHALEDAQLAWDATTALADERKKLARERKAWAKERKHLNDANEAARQWQAQARQQQQQQAEAPRVGRPSGGNWSVAVELIKAGYRVLAKQRHPDVGGSHDDMLRLTSVYEGLMRDLQ